MTTPPKSKVAIMLFIASAVFAFGCAYMIYVFGHLPGDTPQGTKAKIGALGGIRYSLFTALMAFVGSCLMDKLKAERMTAFGSIAN